MSWKPATYVGPYAEVSVKSVMVKTDTCENPTECPNPDAGFCSKCGIRVSDRFSSHEAPEFSFWDVADLTNEQLTFAHTEENEHLEGDYSFQFIPNVTRFGDRSIKRCDNEIGAHELNEGDITRGVAWFKSAFSVELTKIEAHYGNLEIKFGAVFHGY